MSRHSHLSTNPHDMKTRMVQNKKEVLLHIMHSSTAELCYRRCKYQELTRVQNAHCQCHERKIHQELPDTKVSKCGPADPQSVHPWTIIESFWLERNLKINKSNH